MARSFVEKGVHNVVITLGAHGVHYVNRAGETDTIPAERAAGDTFVGQYALEVVLTPPGARFDMAAAVRKANRAAAKTVERKGAQDSIPWRDELSPVTARTLSHLHTHICIMFYGVDWDYNRGRIYQR